MKHHDKPPASAPGTAARRPSPRTPVPALGLIEILRQLPEHEVAKLARRIGVPINAAKRIDPPTQLARALIQRPEAEDSTGLPTKARELLHRIAENGGVLRVSALPQAVEPLVASALVFVRGASTGIELLLPIAYILRMSSWEGDDPRGARALMAQADPQVATAIASHYLGHTATHPVALALESAWRVLSDPVRLAREIEGLSPLERKLLLAVDEVGGEVDTQELLDLEREPLRLRGATGVTPSRRGVGFALERRAFLIPVHPNRHLIPTQVAEIVGARRRARREAERRRIRQFVLGEDHAPRRAHFASDPGPLALAIATLVREQQVEAKPGVGIPRSLIGRFASRFGQEPAVVGLLCSLSRASGLWDASAASEAAPPGSERLADVGRMLFSAWRRGGAWDEARPEGETLRAAGEAREASAGFVIRSLVLDALLELGEGRWVPWEAIAGYVRTDSRAASVARLLERWAQRCGIEPTTPAQVSERIVFETLHTLGVVDLGDGEDEKPTIRVTPRGRAYLSDEAPSLSGRASEFLDNHALRLGGEVKVAQVLSLATFAEVGRVEGHLDVVITPAGVARALAAGVDPGVITKRLERIAALPDPITRMLTQASTILGRAEYVPSAGFLWVDDPEVRQLLSTRRQTVDLFVEPSPPGGLLLAPGVDLDHVARKARALGVEVLVDGSVHHTASAHASARRSSQSGSGRSPSSSRYKQSGTRRIAGASGTRSSGRRQQSG